MEEWETVEKNEDEHCGDWLSFIEHQFVNGACPLFTLKLKPVISDRYITTWYRTSEAIRRAEHILILGHSIHAAESFFCDMVRSNRHAEITLIDRDLDTVCRNLCNTLQLSVNRYTTLAVQGHSARKYDNRITVVQADLTDVDLTPWLESQIQGQG